MEVLGAGCRVGHLQVHVVPVRRRLALAAVCQLQETFDVGAAVVGAGAVNAVGQQQDEAILQEPFAFKFKAFPIISNKSISVN